MKNTLWLGSSSGLVVVLNALGTAFYVRLLGVADFGIYTLIISLTNLFIDFSEVGMSNSIVRFGAESIAEGNHERFKSIIAVLLRFKIIVGITILSIAFLFSEVILRYTFQHVSERVTFFFQISLIAVAANVLVGIFVPIYQSYQKFRIYAVLTTIRSFIKFVFILICVFVLSTFTISIGVWIEIVAAIILVTLSYIYSPFKKFSFQTSDAKIQGEIFSFTKWMSLNTIIYILSTRVDVFFVGMFTNSYSLGIYSAASKIAGILIILANSYWIVLIPEISAAQKVTDIRQKQKKSLSMVILFVAGIVISALFAHPIITIFFGNQFVTAAPIFQVMCIGVGCMVLCYPTNATLFAFNKTFTFPIISLVSILIFIAANIYLIPIFGAYGAGIAFAINGAALLLSSLIMYYLVAVREFKIRAEQEVTFQKT